MSVASLSASRPHRRDLITALAALLLGLLGWGLLFHEEIAAAIRVWIGSTAYNHGFVVLPIALWLAWDRRPAAAGLAPQPTPWPALAALPLGLAWFAADRLGIMEGQQLAALGMLEALLIAWLGWKLARAFAAPLAYLVFLVPFGAFVTPALQVFTARFIDVGLEVLGIPHVVTEFTIEIPEGTFFVAEACAGLRFLIASIAFGALYGLLLYRSPGRRLAFLAASCVVPIIANGVRALGIVVLGHILGSAQAAAADHVIYGWGFFSAVILLLTAAGLPFREDGVPRPAPTPSAARPAMGRAAWLTTAAVLLVSAAGPAVAALLWRGGAVPRLDLPGFVAAPGCRSLVDVPGEAQKFACGEAQLVASVRVLPPEVDPAALHAALLDASGERGVEEVATGRLVVPGVVPPVWRLVQFSAPVRLVAEAAFVDGVPAAGGLKGRLRLAWDGIAGGGGPALVVAVALDPPGPLLPEQHDQAMALLRRFIVAQAKLLTAAAAASAPR